MQIELHSSAASIAIPNVINDRDRKSVNAPLGAFAYGWEAEMSPRPQQNYACPVQLTIDIVGGKWKPLILWLLRAGRPRRFNDLQRAMPDVAHKVLTQHLRQLEQDGLVARNVVSRPHLQVEYCLTAFGATLGPTLNEMATWAKRHHRRFGATIGQPR